MRSLAYTIICVSFFLLFTLHSHSQNRDSTPDFATLYIYHPKTGMTGTPKIHLGDSIICRSVYNSKHEIKIYQEGKAELWIRPKEINTLGIDVKFGEKYYVKCLLLKEENDFNPSIEFVDTIRGKREYAEIRKTRDSLKAIRALDTVPKRNTIYAELGGQALGYSLNYDRLFRVNKKVKNSVSLGLELIDIYLPKGYLFFATPISYNFLFGRNKSYLELGIGLTPIFDRYYNNWWDYYPYGPLHNHTISIYLFASPKIGWRFQPKRGGFFFRATLSPVMHILEYDGPMKYKNASQFNVPAYYYFFDNWWDNIPWSIGPVLPWVGISGGYTFNCKKRSNRSK